MSRMQMRGTGRIATSSMGFAVFMLLAFSASAQPEWKYHSTVDGLRVELRDEPGSKLQAVRVSGTSTESLTSVCDAIFAKDVGSKAEGRFKKREVLRETPTERWTYEQISVPVASDRDYVVHVTLDSPPSSGRCEISFESVEDPAHPPQSGFVRLKSLHGHWSVVPAGDGRVSISYEVFSDPGGSLPAFLVRGGQRDAAVDFFKTILARARNLPVKVQAEPKVRAQSGVPGQSAG